MRITPNLPRLVTTLAFAAALAACGGTADFTLEKDLTVDSTVNAGTVLATFDLAAEAGGAWKHRSKISSIAIDTADAEVIAVFAPPNTATAVSGTVWLLPDGATSPGTGAVQVGTYTDVPVTVGTIISLTLSPELNAFVERAFDGNGRFGVYATGEGAGGAVVSCQLHLALTGRAKWKVL